MWSSVAWARMVATEEKSMHPVRIVLRGPAPFDGGEVTNFDVRLFDVGSLAYLHNCCSYFVGTGLFDLLSEEVQGGEPRPTTPQGQSPEGLKDALESGPSRPRV